MKIICGCGHRKGLRRGRRRQHARRVRSPEKKCNLKSGVLILIRSPRERHHRKKKTTNILSARQLFRGAHAPRVLFPAPRRKLMEKRYVLIPFSFPASSSLTSHQNLDSPSSASELISPDHRSFTSL